MSCRLDQREGSVPSANITPIALAPLAPGQVVAVARAGYIAQSNVRDLDLKKGELCL